MADAGLDLKNPGGKEMIVVGGGALLLALVYFALHKTTPSTGTPAPSGTGGGGGTTATPGVAGMPPLTGNAFTDANVSNPVLPTATGTGTHGGPTGPPLRVKPPVAHASQGAQEILGSGGGDGGGGGVFLPSSGGGGGGGGVSPTAANIYNALVKGGLLPFQAAGVLGNIQNESLGSGGPEAIGDAGTSYGLVQWHSAIYNPSQYVTGNVAADFKKQIAAIVAQFKSMNIGGTTAGQVAGNWASQFEGCKGCAPGGAQWSSRVANAQNIWQQVLAGKFNPPKPAAKPAPGSSQFPGGYANWVKWWAAHPNAKTYGGPGSAGTKAASGNQLSGLFPKVQPKLSKPKLASLGKGLSAGLFRLTAYVTPRKPAPRRPAASKPVSIKGVGIRKQYFA